MYSRVKTLALASCLLIMPVGLSQADGLLGSVPTISLTSVVGTGTGAFGDSGVGALAAPASAALAAVGTGAHGAFEGIAPGSAAASALGLSSIEHSTGKLETVKHGTLAMKGDKTRKSLKDFKKGKKSLKGKKSHKSLKSHKFDKKKHYKPHKKPHKKWHKKPHKKHYPKASVLASGPLSLCVWNYDRDLQYIIYSCDPRRQQ